MKKMRSGRTGLSLKRAVILGLGIVLLRRVAVGRRRATSWPKRVSRLAVVREQRVAGESYYQSDIADWVHRNGREGAALLILEPHNPFSPSGKAVRVDLAAGSDHVTCGYIPERLAAQWFEPVSQLYRSGAWAFCDVQISGGWYEESYLQVTIVPHA